MKHLLMKHADRKLVSVFLCLALSLLLCACGGTANAPAPSAAPAPSEAPATAAPSAAPSPVATLPGDALKPASGGDDGAEDSGSASAAASAKRYVDKPLSELIAEFGEPLSSTYVSSCLGSGEDGELIYEGFKVYTYKDGDSETIQDVIPA